MLQNILSLTKIKKNNNVNTPFYWQYEYIHYSNSDQINLNKYTHKLTILL